MAEVLNIDAHSRMTRFMDAVVKLNATDLHIGEGKAPTVRVDGRLTSMSGEKPLGSDEVRDLAFSLISPEMQERFELDRELDFSYTFEGRARFRINIYYQKGYISAALRLIPTKVRTIDELHLPPVLHNFVSMSQGFFMAVGPAGHGKTTALAAIVDEINHTRQDHIITIEDPIEYVFQQDKCLVDQREVHHDTKSFHIALRSALRQDPDVIMVGEMRDPETISAALTAAETGHMVLATLHTNDAAQTIDRIVDSFPPYQQNQVRYQLANNLIGILSRRLVPMKDGGLINAVELLIVNSAIRNLIRENKIYQIPSVIETGEAEGMISLNRSLAALVKQGMVDQETAESYSINPYELRLILQA